MNPLIIADADACPVKEEIVAVAEKYEIRVCLAASYNHRLPSYGNLVETVQLDASSQSADLYIANRVQKNDVVITQDFGLACLVLAKGAVVLSFRGDQYTNDNIDYLMERRHELAKKRRSGAKTRGPKPLLSADKERFQQKLTKVLNTLQENTEI